MTRKRRSGFAMVIAIFLLSLVAMTLTALSAAIIAEARRTQIQGEGAQLRQLLHAGARIAQVELRSPVSANEHLPATLPASLQQSGAGLIIVVQSIPSSDDVILDVEASLPRHRMSSEIHLKNVGGQWLIAGFDLGK
jgi:hypothetical protein